MNDSSTSSEKGLKFGSAAEPRRFYQFGEFRLDAAERQLYRRGQTVPLTAKSLELLILLVQKHGQIVTKETVMNELWPDTLVEEGNLTQHVFRLRKALRNGADSEGFIETIPRRGYRFMAPLVELPEFEEQSPPAKRTARSWIIAALTVAGLAAAGALLLRPGAAGPAISASAQEAYLKGRHHWNRRTEPDFHKAVEYFRAAVELEPRYAMAWAGLADTYNFLGQAPRAKVAAQRALEIDAKLAEAHAALGNVHMFHEFDLEAAAREFQRAIELKPAYATAHQWYAFSLAVRGLSEQAIVRIEQARELEPLSIIINVGVGDILYYARRHDDAIRQYHKALELDPNFAQAHVSLALAYLRKGLFEDAYHSFEAAEKLGTETHHTELYAAEGQRDKALTELSRWEKRTPGDDFGLARGAAAVGDRDRAMYRLERCYLARSGPLVMIAIDPGFDSMHDDPRFQALLRRMKLRSNPTAV